MSQPRPKPWETAHAGTSTEPGVGASGVLSADTGDSSHSVLNNQNDQQGTTATGTNIPPIPSSITNNTDTRSSLVNDTQMNNNRYGTSYGSSYGGYNSGYGGGGYGNSSYGLGGYGSSYGTGYGSSYGLGGYGSSYGMGGYGSSYGMGGYGSSYGMSGLSGYGMNGMGNRFSRYGNGAGMSVDENGNPINNNSLTDTTARTFQVLENVVYAVGAVAALLESTYYATHNSFFTMLGVADQLKNIGSFGGAFKDTVSGVSDSVKQIGYIPNDSGSNNSGPFGLFALIAWLKKILKKLLGLPTESDKYSNGKNGSHVLLQEFMNWKNGLPNSKTNKNSKSLSLKPLFVFLLALIGLPMFMSKFVRYIEREQKRKHGIIDNNNNNNTNSSNNGNLQPSNQNGIIENRANVDPRSLEFARALYDYIPENDDVQAGGWKEMKLSRGDLVAILNKLDGWSHCRSRDGRVGYVPTNYLEIIKRGDKTITSPTPDAITKTDEQK